MTSPDAETDFKLVIVMIAEAAREGLPGDADRHSTDVVRRHPPATRPAVSLQTRADARGGYGQGRRKGVGAVAAVLGLSFWER